MCINFVSFQVYYFPWTSEASTSTVASHWAEICYRWVTAFALNNLTIFSCADGIYFVIGVVLLILRLLTVVTVVFNHRMQVAGTSLMSRTVSCRRSNHLRKKSIVTCIEEAPSDRSSSRASSPILNLEPALRLEEDLSLTPISSSLLDDLNSSNHHDGISAELFNFEIRIMLLGLKSLHTMLCLASQLAADRLCYSWYRVKSGKTWAQPRVLWNFWMFKSLVLYILCRSIRCNWTRCSGRGW